MSDNKTTIKELKDKVAQFAKERNWQQFHNPKNLVMSIAIETAELMEHLQWIESSDSKEVVKNNKDEIEQELADIAAYILSFCDLNEIDLSNAIERKLEINRKKYPVEKEKTLESKEEVLKDYYNKRKLNKSNK